jgi:acyl carrier protein
MSANHDLDPSAAPGRGNDEPLTATEQVVAGIWERVLECTDIGADSDFLQLGGDSVMMMMVLFQVSEAFGVELPPEVLLESGTLRAFCARIDHA